MSGPSPTPSPPPAVIDVPRKPRKGSQSHGDPFAPFMAPPVNETLLQRTEREAREREAKRISDEIDASLEIERRKLKSDRGVRVLLLGEPFTPDTTSPRAMLTRPHPLPLSPLQARVRAARPRHSNNFNSSMPLRVRLHSRPFVQQPLTPVSVSFSCRTRFMAASHSTQPRPLYPPHSRPNTAVRRSPSPAHFRPA